MISIKTLSALIIIAAVLYHRQVTRHRAVNAFVLVNFGSTQTNRKTKNVLLLIVPVFNLIFQWRLFSAEQMKNPPKNMKKNNSLLVRILTGNNQKNNSDFC